MSFGFPLGDKQENFVTCGHGNKIGDIIKIGSKKIGEVIDVQFDGMADAALVRFLKGSSFVPDQNEKYMCTTYNLPVGSAVSQQGFELGIDKNVRIRNNSYGYVGHGHTWSDLYLTNAQVIGGDSGGPLFKYVGKDKDWREIYGITHASAQSSEGLVSICCKWSNIWFSSGR